MLGGLLGKFVQSQTLGPKLTVIASSTFFTLLTEMGLPLHVAPAFLAAAYSRVSHLPGPPEEMSSSNRRIHKAFRKLHCSSGSTLNAQQENPQTHNRRTQVDLGDRLGEPANTQQKNTNISGQSVAHCDKLLVLPSLGNPELFWMPS